jgi:hypothetical protein
MQPISKMRDITNSAEGKSLSAPEREVLAQVDCAISDTETTGLDRNRNGLTEIASIRAMRDGHSKLRLKLFHRFILPLRPEYQDYLAACEWAKAEGDPPPPYDRVRYEYTIEPQALAVTGTEILREKGLNGPITGIKVNGKKVKAQPFYEVMDEYLAFSRNGEREAWFNAPYDAPFMAKQITDVRAHDLARKEAYDDELISQNDALNAAEKRIILELSGHPYYGLTVSEQAQLIQLMRRFAYVPMAYTNPAHWQCVMYGYMAAHGMGAENTLNAINKKLFPGTEEQAENHSGVQDIVLAAKVGITLPATKGADPHVANMRELYEQMLHKVDPAGTVIEGSKRPHTNGKAGEPPVQGDIVIQFSDAPKKLGLQAQAYWKFLAAYDEVTRANSRVPQHILSIDKKNYRVTINAERSQSLMLNFMKKQAFFFQMLDHRLIASVLPYDSTGTVMDVTLRPKPMQEDDTKPTSIANILKRLEQSAPKTIVIEGVNYRSLRANIDFLTEHANKAETYLSLLKRLHREDSRVGLVLFRPQSDGSLDILVRGHAKAFGDCVLNLPANANFDDITPQLCRDLAMQLKLGAIPNIAEFSHSKEEAETHGDGSDEGLDDADNVQANDIGDDYAVRTHKKAGENIMQLSIAAEIFQLLAHRLNTTPEAMLKEGLHTSHGDLQIHLEHNDATHSHYIIKGSIEAFHDFVALDDQGLKGEKPDNIIRDACWLLYRLQRLPGTSRLRMEGRMAILEQDDGVDTEALGLLHRLGIPFKAYEKQVKIDVHQLMKNAFTWSQGLGRMQQARMKEIKEKKSATLAPPRFLFDVQHALWQGNALALEANERGDCWLLDHSRSEHKSPEHHLLMQHPQGIRLSFNKKRLVIEESDVQGPHVLEISEPYADGSVHVVASPLLFHLAAHRLLRQGVNAKQFISEGSTSWYVPASDSAKTTKALRETSRFLYELSKATGSERQAIRIMDLRTNEHNVDVTFAKQPFLERPRLYRELMTLHGDLAHTDVDAMIRDLQSKLIDPRESDPRRDDLQHMARVTRTQQPTLEALAAALTNYLKLLGGAEYEQDASLNLSRELKGELATLGLLLHEIASIESHSERAKQHLATYGDIHTTQEKLSNVAYGSDQLREALAVARKAIAGDAQGNGGLLREIGTAMATVMDEVASQAYANNTHTDAVNALAEYRAQTIALVGEEHFQHAAYLSAMRYLARGAHNTKHHTIESKVADYLLREAYPHMTHRQREAITHLYRGGKNNKIVESLYASFAKIKKSPNTDFSPQQKKAIKLGADFFIRQYELLVEKNGNVPEVEGWLAENTSIQNTIDEEIRNAYRACGKQYLAMACINAMDASEEYRTPNEDYQSLGMECLAHAGWDSTKIAAEVARIGKRHYSAEQKQHIREQIDTKKTLRSDKLEDVLAAIHSVGNEAIARDMLLKKHYARYTNEAHTMVEGIDDRYYILKSRKALLADIEKSLKETHDLLMVKYHHVRDIQGLLVLLSQQENMVGTLAEEERTRIGEIGEQIAHKPEMVGIHDQTLTNVHSALEKDAERVRAHFIKILNEQSVNVDFSSTENGVTVHIPLHGLEQMFNHWQQHEEEQEKPQHITNTISPHLHPWLAHVVGKLFLQPAIVKNIRSMNIEDAAITCQLQLSPNIETRRTEWEQFRKATHGLGLTMPPLPLDTQELQTVRLALSPRVKRREERLGHATEVLQSLAISEGMKPRAARSMVERARVQARQPGALDRALARSGDRADEVRDILNSYRR